jgi:hypothetical protein
MLSLNFFFVICIKKEVERTESREIAFVRWKGADIMPCVICIMQSGYIGKKENPKAGKVEGPQNFHPDSIPARA